MEAFEVVLTSKLNALIGAAEDFILPSSPHITTDTHSDVHTSNISSSTVLDGDNIGDNVGDASKPSQINSSASGGGEGTSTSSVVDTSHNPTTDTYRHNDNNNDNRNNNNDNRNNNTRERGNKMRITPKESMIEEVERLVKEKVRYLDTIAAQLEDNNYNTHYHHYNTHTPLQLHQLTHKQPKHKPAAISLHNIPTNR